MSKTPSFFEVIGQICCRQARSLYQRWEVAVWLPMPQITLYLLKMLFPDPIAVSGTSLGDFNHFVDVNVSPPDMVL